MTQPIPEAAGRPTPPQRRLVWLPLLFLGLAWGALVPVMTAQAALATVSFFGETASASDHVEQHVMFGRALTLSAALVVVGLALSVWGRSTGGGWVFAVLVVPTLGLGLLWLGTLPDRPPADPLPHAPVACQEHSGGDTRCPGG